EQLREAAGGEDSTDRGDERANDAVARHAAVAVFEVRSVGWRDDKGRVGHDEVEHLPGDRLEERALAQLPRRWWFIEHPVELGEGESAERDVGGDDLARMKGRMQRLDAG